MRSVAARTSTVIPCSHTQEPTGSWTHPQMSTTGRSHDDNVRTECQASGRGVCMSPHNRLARPPAVITTPAIKFISTLPDSIFSTRGQQHKNADQRKNDAVSPS